MFGEVCIDIMRFGWVGGSLRRWWVMESFGLSRRFGVFEGLCRWKGKRIR